MRAPRGGGARVHLDSFTILVAGCAVLMLQGAIFVFFWLRDRASIWLLWWGLPLLLGGSAIAFYAQPGWATDFIAIGFGNATRMLALGCLWQGVRLFQGRPPLVWPLGVMFFGWIALCYLPGFLDVMAPRVIIVSVVNGAICVGAALELRRDRSENLPSRRPLMLVFLSFAAIMVLRVVATVAIAPFPFGAETADALWLGVFVLLVFIHSAFAAILFFAMTRERREAEQRNFAMSDPLTGLLNRRAFSDFGERLSRRSGQRNAMALLVLDLDHFKLVNDQFGHETGDRLLKAFADVSEACVRPTDQLFRMGGEEFCFVLPETTASDALAVAERVRCAVEATEVATSAGPARATVSIGLAASQHAVSLDVLLAAADAAVYEAKARGRNRVVVAEPATLLRASLAEVTAPAKLRA